MDVGKVLGRAWHVTWRYKILWLLGLLASLGQGSPGATFNYTFSGEDFEKYSWEWGPPYDTIDIGGIVAGLIGVICVVLCIVTLIAIIIWVISVIARGGLIAGVNQVEEEGSTGFRKAWAAGRRKFWTLFGLGILAALPLIIFGVVLSILLGLGIAAGVGILESDEASGVATIIMVSTIFGCFLCCGLIILGIVLEQIRIYGERAAIIEDLGWIDAFKRGWQVIKENLGPTVILWLIFLALGFLIFLIMMPVIFAVVVPFIPVFALSDLDAWSIAGLACLGSAIFGIVILLLRSIVTVFTSATWTLAFREMTGAASAPPLEVETEPELPAAPPPADTELPADEESAAPEVEETEPPPEEEDIPPAI